MDDREIGSAERLEKEADVRCDGPGKRGQYGGDCDGPLSGASRRAANDPKRTFTDGPFGACGPR